MKRTFLILTFVVIALSFLALPATSPVHAATPAFGQGNLCGNGSEPDYGFTYGLQQPHWTIGNELVTPDTMTKVDVVLDKLNADNIAQTMILILPADQVGIRVNCAVHFLRYMQLGQPKGQHKDNGFTFLIVIEPSGKIDVHYGVGLANS